MGFDKLMAPLHGASVLQQTAWALLRCPLVHQLIIVTTPERFHTLDFSNFTTPVSRVDGGSQRHHSVANGLANLAEDTSFVAVHDGARPLISSQQIIKVLEQAIQHRAATSSRQITETVKRADSDGFVSDSVSRDNLWLMETPQIFEASLLKQAYASVTASGSLVTDEVSALELIGIPTRLVANETLNPKITFPEDLTLAEQLLRQS